MCNHNNVELTVTGGMSFYAGEVIDTTESRLVCKDCGETLDDNWFHRGEPEQEYEEVLF